MNIKTFGHVAFFFSLLSYIILNLLPAKNTSVLVSFHQECSSFHQQRPKIQLARDLILQTWDDSCLIEPCAIQKFIFI